MTTQRPGMFAGPRPAVLRGGSGLPLVANPAFFGLAYHEDDSATDFLGLGNELANSLQYAPGWYDFGGAASGTIREQSSDALDSTFSQPRGVRITNAAGELKGLCVPIPLASNLRGKRVRFRAQVYPVSGAEVGFTAVLSGRVHKQLWDGTEQVGTSGTTTKAHLASTSGLGHVIAVLPRPAGSTDTTDPFTSYDKPVGVSLNIAARATSFNRVYDSWETEPSSGNSSITVDVPGTGANFADEDHDVFFLDADIDPSSGNYGDADMYVVASEDYSGATGAMQELDFVFQVPDVGESDDPVYIDADCTWLCILPNNSTSAPAAETVADVYYCSLEVLDDDVSTAVLGAGLAGLAGGFGAGHWVPFMLAYPVYTPTNYTVTGPAWRGNAGASAHWLPSQGFVVLASSTNTHTAHLMLPCGAVVVEVTAVSDDVQGATIDFYACLTSRGQLRTWAASPVGHVPLELVQSTMTADASAYAVSAVRNRVGTLTTTQAAQLLVDAALPDGSESLELMVVATAASQTYMGMSVLALVDQRLASGGVALRT